MKIRLNIIILFLLYLLIDTIDSAGSNKHPLKASSPIDFTEEGIVEISSLNSLKISSSI